jgi:FemAB-related protein (PEP-CTERM system-associated)
MTALVVREATAAEGAAWDRCVAEHGGSVFQRWGWKRVYEEAYALEAPYLAAYAGEALAGVLPLVRLRSPLFGEHLVSLPWLNTGGPVGTPDACRALAAAAVARQGRARAIELRQRASHPLGLVPTARKITVVLPLVAGDPEGTLRRLDSKVRSQVRRATRDGVTVRFGHDQLAPFHAVFVEHMRDLGSPAHAARFFGAIAQLLGEEAWVGVAYAGDTPIAAGFAIVDGDELEMTWASALRRHARCAPNMALYGAFLQRAAAEGLAHFNFGRCTPDSGTHRFKRQWGGVDEPLGWERHPAPAAGNPDGGGGAARAASRLWRHLPIPLVRALGPPLLKGIPV